MLSFPRALLHLSVACPLPCTRCPPHASASSCTPLAAHPHAWACMRHARPMNALSPHCLPPCTPHAHPMRSCPLLRPRQRSARLPTPGRYVAPAPSSTGPALEMAASSCAGPCEHPGDCLLLLPCASRRRGQQRSRLQAPCCGLHGDSCNLAGHKRAVLLADVTFASVCVQADQCAGK